MNKNTASQANWFNLEVLKWLVVTTLLIVVIVGNYFYRDCSLPIRALAVMLIITIAGCVAMMTTKGKYIIAFAHEARTEVCKVIWPSRKKTLYTTLIVASVTTMMSLILWGLDSILVHVVSSIIGLRF